MITKVRHMGVVVNDIEKSIEIFKSLFGGKDEDIRLFMPMCIQCKFALIPVAGIELELIQPVTERFEEMLDNPVEGLNHIAFEVRGMEKYVSSLEKKGVRPANVAKRGIVKMD
jgi:methylmalonyl-CoA/ethylmalonyl-CoA epimerase